MYVHSHFDLLIICHEVEPVSFESTRCQFAKETYQQTTFPAAQVQVTDSLRNKKSRQRTVRYKRVKCQTLKASLWGVWQFSRRRHSSTRKRQILYILEILKFTDLLHKMKNLSLGQKVELQDLEGKYIASNHKGRITGEESFLESCFRVRKICWLRQHRPHSSESQKTQVMQDINHLCCTYSQ